MKENWAMKLIYSEIFPIVTFSGLFDSTAGDLSYAEQLPNSAVNLQVYFLYVVSSLVELRRATTH